VTNSDRARVFAALLFFAPSIALAQEPAPPEDEQAREHFRRGLGLARAGDCEGAIAELEASFRLVQRPNTLFNLAQCEERLHRYDRAIARYEEYLRVAPADADDRVAVEDTLASLRELLGTVSIESNVPAEVWLEERVVGEAPGEILVPGGRRAIELRAEGYLPARQEVDVTARETTSIAFTLEQAEQHFDIEHNVTVERPPLPIAVFATGIALTAAGLIVGTIGGAMALAERERIDAMDPRIDRDALAGGVRDAALVADIGFITGGVFLVATIIVAFLTDFGGEAPAASAWITSDGAGVVVGGAL
jgi:tetratricopeptide (TPR) repeat protein